jgi:hypothetical protein
MKSIIWGITYNLLLKKGFIRDYDIIAFTDNNEKFWGLEYNGVPIVSPAEIKNMKFDKIIIGSSHIQEITKQIKDELLADEDQIITYKDIENKIKEQVIEKYKSSKDPEINHVVQYYRNNELNIFGYYKGKRERDLVYRDENHQPYIIFEGHRMYFPMDYKFLKVDGKEFVNGILYEQGEGSPHRYIRDKEDELVGQDKIIVDAGVCEGNFALKYIEKAKKIYLIECDPRWLRVLRLTFAPFKDKVVFCDKFLTRYESKTTTTIDALVKEKIDFLKMDIEGTEVDALLGAKETLRNSKASCAICCYHRQNDEENIRFILNSLGYSTETSTGYMFFPYDENIVDTLDLRRGIIYGRKCNYGTMEGK